MTQQEAIIQKVLAEKVFGMAMKRRNLQFFFEKSILLHKGLSFCFLSDLAHTKDTYESPPPIIGQAVAAEMSLQGPTTTA